MERIDSSELDSDDDINDTSRNLTRMFYNRINTLDSDFTFDWNTDFVDIDAQRHTEKWVEKIGFHFQLYASRFPPPIVTSTIPATVVNKSGVRVPLQKLQFKVISGDVSGTIGEALLASILLVRYGLLPRDIIHLKATKQTGRAPDFYIRNITTTLAQDIEPNDPSKVTSPLVIEAKGASRFDDASIAGKLRNAFEQIEGIRTRYGLASIFVRDAPYREYHALMVVVRP